MRQLVSYWKRLVFSGEELATSHDHVLDPEINAVPAEEQQRVYEEVLIASLIHDVIGEDLHGEFVTPGVANLLRFGRQPGVVLPIGGAANEQGLSCLRPRQVGVGPGRHRHESR